MIRNCFDDTYLSTVNSLKQGLESHSFFLYLMIYTEKKKNPIYDTKTSSKPHTPYAIQMEVLQLKKVEVTDIRGAELMAAWWSQRGSAGLLHLLMVHFLWHRKSSLSETSLHFLVWKWFLADPDQKFWVVNHFENLSSLGLLFPLSSVQRDQQTKAPLPVHSLSSLHLARSLQVCVSCVSLFL